MYFSSPFFFQQKMFITYILLLSLPLILAEHKCIHDNFVHIHNQKMERQDREGNGAQPLHPWRIDPVTMRRKRMSGSLPEPKPLRVKLDLRFLKPFNDRIDFQSNGSSCVEVPASGSTPAKKCYTPELCCDAPPCCTGTGQSRTCKYDSTDSCWNTYSSGVCRQKNDWARLGDPSTRKDHDAAAHQPRCSENCDGLPPSSNNPQGGCNCYYQCQFSETADDLLWKQRRDFIELQLFPRAVEFLESALKVRRLPLNLERTDCGCGRELLNLQHAVDDQGLTAPELYQNYEEHDLVLFVTARSTRLMDESTLAYACSCQDDWFGRPVFGHVNWGANKIDFANTDKFREQLGVALHEIHHALGFTSQKYGAAAPPPGEASSRSRYVDRTTLATRWAESEGVPDRLLRSEVVQAAKMGPVRFSDGVKENPITMMVMPTVVEQARAHFDCDTLSGAELENQGSSGTAASHWEKRVYGNEFMTGSSSFAPVVSPITLAFLHDTGYYDANLTVGLGVDDDDLDTDFRFGRNEGCSFALKRCANRKVPYTCLPSQKGFWGCTFDRRSRGLCTNTKYSAALPQWYQYFEDATFGGVELADFCPRYKYNDKLLAYCTEPLYQQNNIDVRGEVFGKHSRCIDGDLLIATKKGLTGSGGCYPLRCVNGTLRVRVVHQYYECPPNAQIEIDGFNGKLRCPSKPEIATLCEQVPQLTEAQWPTVTSVAPVRDLNVGDLVTVTGTNLENIASIEFDSITCQNFTDTDTPATKQVCEIVTVKATDAPAADPLNDGLDFFTDTFFNQPAKADFKAVYIVFEDGLTATYMADVSMAAPRLASTTTLALFTAAVLLLML